MCGIPLYFLAARQMVAEKKKKNISLVDLFLCEAGICRALAAISAYISHLVSIIKVTWNFDSFVMQIPTRVSLDCGY